MDQCPDCGSDCNIDGTRIHWDGCPRRESPWPKPPDYFPYSILHVGPPPAVEDCKFCGDHRAGRNVQWVANVGPDGWPRNVMFYPICDACMKRPKHVLDAIIAAGFKPLD